MTIVKIVRLCLARKKRKQDEKDRLRRRDRKAAKSACVPIRHPNYHKPDPMIYSQYYLMGLGLAVTWDNPDIELHKGGVAVSSGSIEADTDYEVVARLWNISFDAPVVGMPVIFTYLDFGAGTSGNPIGQTTANLSVIGGTQNPSFASVPWHTPKADGHYCIQVKLVWPDDKNPNNNLGQENLQIVKAHSPGNFRFQVRNADPITHRYHVETDTYTIPPLIDCDDDKRKNREKEGDQWLKGRNRRSDHPIPAGWSVACVPEVWSLAPAEEITIEVTITAPADFRGRQPFNLHVFNEHSVMTGGVTIHFDQK